MFVNNGGPNILQPPSYRKGGKINSSRYWSLSFFITKVVTIPEDNIILDYNKRHRLHFNHSFDGNPQRRFVYVPKASEERVLTPIRSRPKCLVQTPVEETHSSYPLFPYLFVYIYVLYNRETSL